MSIRNQIKNGYQKCEEKGSCSTEGTVFCYFNVRDPPNEKRLMHKHYSNPYLEKSSRKKQSEKEKVGGNEV